MTRAKKERAAPLPPSLRWANLFSCTTRGCGISTSALVGAIPAAALEHYSRGRENPPNSVVALWTGNLSPIRLIGHILFEFCPAFCAGKIIQRHGTSFYLVLTVIVRGLTCSAFGRVTVRTPFSNSALAFSDWTSIGSMTLRSNDP